ncbi:hypothetical protein L6164_027763 [Bauhinia variegata]|uniref:Uncharacterized protein n=1 Tax=Bauhinia variegata TaxID=167791 RepID=A0ACB9LVI0_BAUVA|nr:hypothetical protein L6164_027763 [Bauhinia variegata]
MGVCASSRCRDKKVISGWAKSTSKGEGESSRRASIRSSSAITVIELEGGIKELKQAMEAKVVISQNPNCFLCNSESMYIGTCMPRLPDEEMLLPGQIYFLVPLSQANKPLSLPLLCELAIKASSALTL